MNRRWASERASRGRTGGPRVNDVPPSTPWAVIGLLVLGVILFYAAFVIDTGGPPGAVRRTGTRLLVLVSGVSLVAAVVVGALS